MNSTALLRDDWTQSSDIPNFKSPITPKPVLMSGTLDSNSPPESGFIREYPVWVISTSRGLHSLNRPVVLQAKNEGGIYFAENDVLEICGYGDTVGEALDEAIKELAYYHEYYGNLDEDEVIGHGVTIRNRFLAL